MCISVRVVPAGWPGTTSAGYAVRHAGRSETKLRRVPVSDVYVITYIRTVSLDKNRSIYIFSLEMSRELL